MEINDCLINLKKERKKYNKLESKLHQKKLDIDSNIENNKNIICIKYPQVWKIMILKEENLKTYKYTELPGLFTSEQNAINEYESKKKFLESMNNNNYIDAYYDCFESIDMDIKELCRIPELIDLKLDLK